NYLPQIYKKTFIHGHLSAGIFQKLTIRALHSRANSARECSAVPTPSAPARAAQDGKVTKSKVCDTL
ncbi:MAG: hypothetical protein J1E77_08975, partial [Prevotella sp.]|nr:hypothetical protein [Prevotella sp.]